MSSARNVATWWQGGRLSDLLSACPQPGGGVHSWLVAAAHQFRKAGLTKAEVEQPLTDRMPRSATTFVILTALARTKCGERWLNPQCHLVCAVLLRPRTNVPPASHVELVTRNAPRSPLTAALNSNQVLHLPSADQVQLTAACSPQHSKSTSTAAHDRDITHALLSSQESSPKDSQHHDH